MISTTTLPEKVGQLPFFTTPKATNQPIADTHWFVSPAQIAPFLAAAASYTYT